MTGFEGSCRGKSTQYGYGKHNIHSKTAWLVWIARALGIDRETVARYVHLRRGYPKPATNAPTGSVDQDISKSGSQSPCEPFHKVAQDKLQVGLPRQRIYQDLRDEHGLRAAITVSGD